MSERPAHIVMGQDGVNIERAYKMAIIIVGFIIMFLWACIKPMLKEWVDVIILAATESKKDPILRLIVCSIVGGPCLLVSFCCLLNYINGSGEQEITFSIIFFIVACILIIPAIIAKKRYDKE